MSQSSESELDPVEQEALDLIESRGGLHQSELWKELDINSRKASRVVSTLQERGLIEREESVYDGHRTYFLTPQNVKLDYSLLVAGDMLSPFIGNEDLDPIESDAFTQWVLELAYE